MVKAGSEYLFKNFKDSRSEWFTYGHFYAAPAQYMRGGETWEKWYALLRETLVKKATVKGDTAFWDSNETGLDGGRNVGPVYSTSVYIDDSRDALSLRSHLPAIKMGDQSGVPSKGGIAWYVAPALSSGSDSFH